MTYTVERRGALPRLGRRGWLAWAGACVAAPTVASGRPTDIHLVSDAWHGLTRHDGSGLYFDLIRAVYQRQGVRPRIEVFPYARCVQMVREKRADAWVASFLREKDFPLYPQWPFDRNAQQVVYLRRPGGFVFRGMADLRGRRVAWLRDFGLDRYIDEPMVVTEVDSIAGALQMLRRDRIDCFIGAESDIRDDFQARQEGGGDLETRFVMHLGLYLAFADTGRGAALRGLWDTEMATLHKAQAFKAIYLRAGYPYPF